MATSPNYNWPEPDNTDLVKNGALAIRTAVNAIDTSLAELKGGTTGQVLSKTSATDMDFTWVAQDDSNAIQNAIVDAKGDIIAATAADTPARLAVGANDTVLTADSSTATGLKWAAPAAGMTNPMTTTGDTIYSSSGSTPARLGIGTTGQVLTVAGGVPSWATAAGGGGGLTLISESIPSGATSIDFTSISSDYKQLTLVWVGVYASANNSNLLIRLNNDSSTAYKQREVETTGSSTVSLYMGDTTDIPCMVRTTSTNDNENATGYATIFNANSTTKNKYIETVTSYKRADNSTNTVRRGSIRYVSNSAISQINFQRGETGGTINVTSGGYIQLWGLK
jgi:hypothetical protein